MAEADHTPGKGRVEAFSDGVIAIIITIMVLELHLPEALAQGLHPAVLMQVAPKFAAYLMSFLVVAIMWVNHHAITHTLRSAQSGFLWLNLLLLFWMSLIPLVTAFYGDHPGSALAAALYGVVLAATGWSFTWIRAWLAGHETESDALKALHRGVLRKSIIGAVIYSAAVPLAFVNPAAPVICFVVVPVMFLWPNRWSLWG